MNNLDNGGKKKGKRGKIVKWFIIGFIALIVLGALASEPDKTQNTNEISPTEEKEESRTTAEEPMETEKTPEATPENETRTQQGGTKIVPYDVYQWLSDKTEAGEDLAYKINDKAKTFMQKTPNLFPTKKETKVVTHTDFNKTYAHIEKNDTKYGDKLMYLGYVEVVQIREKDIGIGTYLTSLNLIDDDRHQYYVFYIGELADVLEGDTIEVYGLPLGMSRFTNVGNGKTLCPILAGSYVKKVMDY